MASGADWTIVRCSWFEQNGVQAVFLVAAPLAAITLVIVLALKEVPLRSARRPRRRAGRESLAGRRGLALSRAPSSAWPLVSRSDSPPASSRARSRPGCTRRYVSRSLPASSPRPASWMRGGREVLDAH